MMIADVGVHALPLDEGKAYGVRPHNYFAERWVEENMKDPKWEGSAIRVQPDDLEELLDRMREGGMTVGYCDCLICVAVEEGRVAAWREEA